MRNNLSYSERSFHNGIIVHLHFLIITMGVWCTRVLFKALTVLRMPINQPNWREQHLKRQPKLAVF